MPASPPRSSTSMRNVGQWSARSSATAAVFFRMDDATSCRLLEAHDRAPVASLPPRFAYDRRCVASLCGSMMVHFALQRGHDVDASHETLEESPDLAEVYGRMRDGAL